MQVITTDNIFDQTDNYRVLEPQDVDLTTIVLVTDMYREYKESPITELRWICNKYPITFKGHEAYTCIKDLALFMAKCEIVVKAIKI